MQQPKGTLWVLFAGFLPDDVREVCGKGGEYPSVLRVVVDAVAVISEFQRRMEHD